MSANTPDLESLISERRRELIEKLVELKTEARIETVETRDKLGAKLSQLAHIMKEGVLDGWASLGASVTLKLDRWLAESAPDLPKNGKKS